MKQEEVRTRRGQAQLRGTVNAAAIEGEPDCPNIFVSSVYDTKPVHFISTPTKKTWFERTKQLFSKSKQIPL